MDDINGRISIVATLPAFRKLTISPYKQMARYVYGSRNIPPACSLRILLVSLKGWLSKWIDRLNGSARTVRMGNRRPSRPQRTRLVCEVLESRLAPAAVNVTTFVDSTQGLNQPGEMAFDASGNPYIPNILSTPGNALANTVSKVNPSGVLTTFVDSIGRNSPFAVAFDANGNLYIANDNAHSISKVTPAGVVSTFVDFDFSANVDFVEGDPYALAFDAAGNLYVAFAGGASYDSVAKVTPSGTVSIFVDNSHGLDGPRGLAFDARGNLYVANFYGSTIDEVTPAGVVSTFVSSTQGLTNPTGLAFDASGNLYVANTNGGTVAKVTPSGTLSTVFGDPEPMGLCFDRSGDLFVSNDDGTIYKATFNAAPITPQVSVNPVSISYGTALENGQLSGIATATVNGQVVAVTGTFTYTSAAGAVLGAGDGQSESVTFTPSDTTDYTAATTTVIVNVARATPQVSLNPVNITFGTALANGQLSGTATWLVGGQTVVVAGTFSYTSAAGTVLPAGSGQSEAVTFTPSDTVDYTAGSTAVIVNVAQPPPEPFAAAITLPATIGSSAFGSSVAVSGNNVLVGASSTNNYSGAAYLYNTAGTLLQTLNDPGNTFADRFGYSVAFSGNDMLVGAPAANNGRGAAYLYSTAGTLLQTFNDPGTDGTDVDLFG
jgi:sugar lactone lactonase YvrE